MTTTRTDIYTRVTDAIIEKLEQGFIPWVKDWSCAGTPRNRISGRAYSGINFLILSLSDYQCDEWLTFKQAKELGGCVRKGEKGTGIVFYKPIRKQDENGDDKSYGVLRTYTVFNVEQCEGIEPSENKKNVLVGPLAYFHYIENIRANNSINIRYGNPTYYTVGDYVTLPHVHEFDSEVAYCQSATHEFVHWTGHPSRHDRFTSFDETLSTANERYAAEELVAELGAAMMCSTVGITAITTHAAYIQGWLKVLKNDKTYIFKAAAKAKKAADYLMGIERDADQSQTIDSDSLKNGLDQNVA